MHLAPTHCILTAERILEKHAPYRREIVVHKSQLALGYLDAGRKHDAQLLLLLQNVCRQIHKHPSRKTNKKKRSREEKTNVMSAQALRRNSLFSFFLCACLCFDDKNFFNFTNAHATVVNKLHKVVHKDCEVAHLDGNRLAILPPFGSVPKRAQCGLRVHRMLLELGGGGRVGI